MFAPVPPAPDWLLPVVLGLLFGPYLLAIAGGKPAWVRDVVWVHLALVALMLLRNILTPVPVFGTFAIFYGLMLGLTVFALAARAKIFAGWIPTHIWCAAVRPEKQIK